MGREEGQRRLSERLGERSVFCWIWLLVGFQEAENGDDVKGR